MAAKKVIKVQQELGIMECYPINLIADALAGEENYSVWDFYVPDVLEVVAKMDYQDGRVIELRYKEGLTLEETGKRIGKTRERARQIQNNGLYALRRKMFAGECRVIKRSEYANLLEQYNDLCAKFTRLAERVPEGTDVAPAKVMNCCEDIDNLDFSARTRNCLHRAGLLTVTDVIRFDKDPKSDWKSLWGLGVGSRQELRTKIHKCTGYTLHV